MRIIAGRFKGRPIKAPKGRDTRPTVDRVREAMMSSIASAMAGGVSGDVLDAFAGSGALGLEALSRGAESCVFYDKDRNARAAVLANIATLGLTREEAAFRQTDCTKAVARGSVTGRPFSLVLLDPPYDLPARDVLGLVASLAEHGDTAPGCLVVYEHRAGDFSTGDLPAHLGGKDVSPVVEKRYGIVGVTMFTLE